MQDFNSYSKEEQKEQKRSEQSAAESDRLAKQLASALAGKGEADILRAIYKEAERGRKARARGIVGERGRQGGEKTRGRR